MVEQLGSEILLDTRVGEATDRRERRPDDSACKRPHDKLRLALNPDRLHLFDADADAI